MKPIYVAIDTPDFDRARTIAEAVRKHASGVKLGLEYFCAQGPDGVADIAELGLDIFLDLKLHDIPNTVAKAIHCLHDLHPKVLTVHAAGGQAMMRAAKEAAPPGTKVVGVTVLTSLDQDDLPAVGVDCSLHDQVARLARLSHSAGLDGIVCSGAEVAVAREKWPGGFFVVPGIRPAGDKVGDQKRVVTPAQALRDGASMLVIGRPITGAADPAAAIRAIAESLGGVNA